MIDKAIDKILELAKPNIQTIDNNIYCDKMMRRIDKELYASPLAVHTLTAIVDYIMNGTDDNEDEEVTSFRRFVIHIEDYNKVVLTRELSKDKRREELLCATDNTRTFPYGQFMQVENFIIAMQSYFLQDDMTAQLLNLVSSVSDSNSVQQTDDGLTQSVTAKTGIVTSSVVAVPNPVELTPICTFSEAMQPARRFVFRLRGGDEGVTAALFEADGNAWKHEAICNIRDYLSKELAAMLDDVIILA